MADKAIETSIVSGGYTGALKEFLLSRDFVRIPITIAKSDSRFSSSVSGPCLYGRQTASPGEYAPFYVTALLGSNAASGQADIILATTGEDDINQFLAGDVIYLSDDNAYESLTIDSVDVDTNTITCTGDLVNSYTTAANAKVYLYDGTEDSANVVVVEESIDFSETDDVRVSAYLKGSFDETKLERATNFVKADCQRLDIRTIQL